MLCSIGIIMLWLWTLWLWGRLPFSHGSAGISCNTAKRNINIGLAAWLLAKLSAWLPLQSLQWPGLNRGPWTLNIESLQSKSKSMVKVIPYSLICIPGILCNLRSCTSETSDVSGSSFATLGFLLLSSGNMHNSKLKAAGKSLRHAAYGPRSIFGIESRVNCFWRVYYRSSGLGRVGSGRVYNIFSNYVNQSTNLPKYVIIIMLCLCIMIVMFLYVSLTFLAFLDPWIAKIWTQITDVTQRDLKDSEFWRHCQTVTEIHWKHFF